MTARNAQNKLCLHNLWGIKVGNGALYDLPRKLLDNYSSLGQLATGQVTEWARVAFAAIRSVFKLMIADTMSCRQVPRAEQTPYHGFMTILVKVYHNKREYAITLALQ